MDNEVKDIKGNNPYEVFHNWLKRNSSEMKVYKDYLKVRQDELIGAMINVTDDRQNLILKGKVQILQQLLNDLEQTEPKE